MLVDLLCNLPCTAHRAPSGAGFRAECYGRAVTGAQMTDPSSNAAATGQLRRFKASGHDAFQNWLCCSRTPDLAGKGQAVER